MTTEPGPRRAVLDTAVAQRAIMPSVDLIFGAGRLDRQVADAEELLLAYRRDTGTRYLDHVPCTPPDRLVPEDLAVTILINSRVGSTAFAAVQDRGGELDLSPLPDKPLQATTPSERQQVAELIAEVARWPGFAASVASKVLHKKRPALIPIIDNQAIFGAYMNPLWPKSPSLTDSVYAASRIGEALDWIAFDTTRPENATTWASLEAIEPSRTLIDLFDMVWWIHFRTVEPVRVAVPSLVEPLPSTEPLIQAETEPRTILTGDLATFVDDDGGYLAWVRDHPAGFVVNTHRTPSGKYLKLHRATCAFVSGTPPRGVVWTKDYSKVCAEDRATLDAWARGNLSATLADCPHCRP